MNHIRFFGVDPRPTTATIAGSKAFKFIEAAYKLCVSREQSAKENPMG